MIEESRWGWSYNRLLRGLFSLLWKFLVCTEDGFAGQIITSVEEERIIMGYRDKCSAVPDALYVASL